MSSRLFCALMLAVLLGACNEPPAPQAPDPQTILQSIPPADSARYEHIRDMKNWQNPYLIVRAGDVVLYDVADNAEIAVKTNDLLTELAKLPASNWPYGRVVAAIEVSGNKLSEQDKIAIRRNKGIVGGMLQGAHIAVDWVPSA